MESSTALMPSYSLRHTAPDAHLSQVAVMQSAISMLSSSARATSPTVICSGARVSLYPPHTPRSAVTMPCPESRRMIFSMYLLDTAISRSSADALTQCSG